MGRPLDSSHELPWREPQRPRGRLGSQTHALARSPCTSPSIGEDRVKLWLLKGSFPWSEPGSQGKSFPRVWGRRRDESMVVYAFESPPARCQGKGRPNMELLLSGETSRGGGSTTLLGKRRLAPRRAGAPYGQVTGRALGLSGVQLRQQNSGTIGRSRSTLGAGPDGR